MDVLTAAARSCRHCPTLKQELQRTGVEHRVAYVEDNPDIRKEYDLKTSPNLIVDGELVFSGMPEARRLREILTELGARQTGRQE